MAGRIALPTLVALLVSASLAGALAPADAVFALLGTTSPVRCVAVPPALPVCHGLDAAPAGAGIHYVKAGRVPVNIVSSVRGIIGGCNPDDFECGTFTAESDGESIDAVTLSIPVVVLGLAP